MHLALSGMFRVQSRGCGSRSVASTLRMSDREFARMSACTASILLMFDQQQDAASGLDSTAIPLSYMIKTVTALNTASRMTQCLFLHSKQHSTRFLWTVSLSSALLE